MAGPTVGPIPGRLSISTVLWFARCLAEEAALGELPPGHPIDELAAHFEVTKVVEGIRDEVAAEQFERRAS